MNKNGGDKMREIKIVSPNYPTSTDFEIVLEVDDNIDENGIKKEIINELAALNIKIDENNIDKIDDSTYRVGLIVGEKGHGFKLIFDENLNLPPELKKRLHKAIYYFLIAQDDKKIQETLKILESMEEINDTDDEEFI
jgi:hypothetical protein